MGIALIAWESGGREGARLLNSGFPYLCNMHVGHINAYVLYNYGKPSIKSQI